MVNDFIKNNADASWDEMRQRFVGDGATRSNPIPNVMNDIQPIQQDVFSEWIAEAVENEYSLNGHLPTPRWVSDYYREMDREAEQRIDDAISAEDNRVYHEFLREARRTRRAIREILAGRGGGSITELREYQSDLQRRIAYMRRNPRVSGRRARGFRNYIRDQN